MNFLIFSLLAFLAASFCAWAGRGEKKILFSCVGVMAASAIGLVPAVGILAGGPPLGDGWKSEIPGLTLAFGIDGLTALFLAVIFFLSIVVAIYSIGYLKGQAPLQKYSPFFPLLVGSMAAVVTTRDGFLFLICWEVMSLASFFLVTVEHSSREVRHAGWVYLISTHLGTVFLAVFFILLQNKAGSFLFADFAELSLSTPLAGFLFVLAVIGFMTKAGLFPFHVWLPHAHPAAASPISALMSGVMIMTGFYGLLRSLTFLEDPQVWWGGVLLIMGIFSAVFGILWAFVQEDIKRFLAYSSVENAGLIAIAIGLGILGQALDNPAIAALGFAGGLLHFVNHALFKGLLFLSAGGIVHSTHTRAMGRLGGLKMPVTRGAFLVASLGACAFPVFNGFTGEWLIYLGLFRGGQSFGHFPLFLSVAGIVAMAFAGGLALAAFSKTFGLVFLGNARSKNAEAAREIPRLMRLPLLILAFCCLAIGIYPQAVLKPVGLAVAIVAPQTGAAGIIAGLPWNWITLASAGMFFFFLLFLAVGKPWRKKSPLVPTWGCGYAHPSSTMQYSGASFAEPISTFFKPLLKPQVQFNETSFDERFEDIAEKRFFFPLFEKSSVALAFLRRLQKNRAQDYLALMFLALIALLLWEVWFGI